MKGVILAGGKGTRMWPLTAVTNKHLVPVGNLPMIEYPLNSLKKMGIGSIAIVTGGEHFQDIAKYLGEVHPEINFSFFYQKEAGGISQALSLVEDFVKNEKIVVILGDNVFEEDFKDNVRNFEDSDLGAMFFLKRVIDAQRFGVAEVRENRIASIEEKPDFPKSDLAVTGLYFYDSSVFDKIRTLKPSARGELEVSDLNNLYVSERKAGFHILEGFWSDAGTFESKEKCEEFVKIGLEEGIKKNLIA